MTDRIPISEATDDQLRAYATTALGLDIHHNAKGDTIRAKISEAAPGVTSIPILGAAPAPQAAMNLGASRNTRPRLDGKKGTEVRIRIEVSDKAGGDRPVPVGVNGSVMLIPRGEPVWVPEEYVEALSHSEEWSYDEYTAGDGGLPKPRTVPSYPFAYV